MRSLTLNACWLLLVTVLSGTSVGPAWAQGRNEITYKNGTGENATVRVFPAGASGSIRARSATPDADPSPARWIREVRIGRGGSASITLPSGGYYHVARFGDAPPYSYAQAEPYTLNPGPGEYVRATITLYTVVGGNLGSKRVGTDAFGEEGSREDPAPAPRPVNEITHKNGTGLAAVVRVLTTDEPPSPATGPGSRTDAPGPAWKRVQDLALQPGGSVSLSVGNGRYRHVVRFGGTPYIYARSTPYSLNAGPGKAIRTTITLSPAAGGVGSGQGNAVDHGLEGESAPSSGLRPTPAVIR